MKIVWIGAGNLATQLGEALHRAGHETLQVFSRTMASAEVLAGRLGCLATDGLDAVVPGADVYRWLCVLYRSSVRRCLVPAYGREYAEGCFPWSRPSLWRVVSHADIL